MTASRIFLWVLIAFIVGIAVRSFIDIGYVFIAMLVTAGAVLWAISVLRRAKLLFVYGLCVLAAAIGIFRFDAVMRGRPDLSAWFGRNVVLTGVVHEDSERTEIVQRVKLRVFEVDRVHAAHSFFVLVTAGYYPMYRVGDELLVTGILERPENLSEDFDYASYLAKDRVFATMGFPDVTKINARKG
ncbi:MAG: Uncharacterized protein G01um1014106_469, partial [Parcubacteria group bacterium Gr01-1014_106]